MNDNQKIRPSILDRLVFEADSHGMNSLAGASSAASHFDTERAVQASLRKLKESVRRDLENLLNTRVPVQSIAERYESAQFTVLDYGMHDLASVNFSDIDQQAIFVRNMETIIRRYEPRFKQLNVVVANQSASRDRLFRFRIEGTLYADPAPEFVSFDSSLEPDSKTIAVKKASGGA